MTRLARVDIHPDALSHNLSIARSRAGRARIMAVIKANAYGHGDLLAARALDAADAFAVATIEEALRLRRGGVTKPLLAFQGAVSPEDYARAVAHSLTLVVYHPRQIDWLASAPRPWPALWLKVDTGMGRLGLPPDAIPAALSRLGDACEVLMSHLACADTPEHPLNRRQLEAFERIARATGLPTSLYNSAGLLSFDLDTDWARPGIMLYGASPLKDATAADLGLQPAMTLRAPLISVMTHRAGDAIGYGAAWRCPEAMPVGVVAIGYADGYPRAASGAPVLVNGRRCAIVGRISMDAVSIDLRACPEARPGDWVTLWGPGLPVDEVASVADTIAYEPLCHAGSLAMR